MDINIFTLIGELIVIAVIILAIFIIITLILGKTLLKTRKLLFPRLLLFTLDLTYPVIKKLLILFKKDDLLIDRISIDLRNRMNHNTFKTLDSKDVVIILPHCLRAQKCPAVLGNSGLECVECGKCSIGVFKIICDKKGIGLYVVPGSTFIKQVIKQRPIKGAIGVACPIDLNNMMTSLSQFTTQGVGLLKDGCINTLVNEDDVIEILNIPKPVTHYTKEEIRNGDNAFH
ncbi:DUF116 domain-containing protein [Methanosphaera cuniculi]|uniref:DUF116 domain-containing protein n=1 Tax=Methanosphaera cuniculi TaxID=1077256 RepID=A0A2A2HCR0_9EURY|nr:DUF116 domain-containing protein [Methanosphaera cuniculi]PAV07219.1 hypothetical protein ASJ82_05990 [Methanosphaera cuniculi]PWL08474.1 hypothetical protein MSCUN_06330 [Methanosphaera cuniculi]